MDNRILYLPVPIQIPKKRSDRSTGTLSTQSIDDVRGVYQRPAIQAHLRRWHDEGRSIQVLALIHRIRHLASHFYPKR